ncbi:MAG: sigma-70 family RNA polymerase sigma factor [Candidatus Limnocylindrales bacterium]
MFVAPAASTEPRDPETGPDPSRARSVAPDVDFATRLSDELPRLSRLAMRLSRDHARAEDLVGEAALRAWTKRGQLREGAPIGPWLNRILVNLAIDRSRARYDEVDLAGVEDRWRDDDYTVDPEQVLARAEQREDLEDALARMPVGYRTVVVLHDAADMTTPAIADALDIGLPAAKQRLRRGRMMLVSALAEDDPKRVASLAQPMRCWKARSKISAYLDEELQAEGRRAVEEHLAECPTCPPLYASLVGLQEALGDLRDTDKVVPDEIAARITESIAKLRPA